MPGVVVVEPEPVLLPPVVVLGVLPAEPVVPPLPTLPLELPPMPLLVPVLVLLLPADERWSRMHLSRSRPVRWSHSAVLGPVAPVVLLVLGVVVVVVVVVVLCSVVEVLGVLELLLEVLGLLVSELLPALLLGVLLLPVLLPEAASFMHFSFSRPVSISQRAELVALLLSVLEPVLLVLGLVALGLLLLELPDVCAIDALEIPSSAAATAT